MHGAIFPLLSSLRRSASLSEARNGSLQASSAELDRFSPLFTAESLSGMMQAGVRGIVGRPPIFGSWVGQLVLPVVLACECARHSKQTQWAGSPEDGLIRTTHTDSRQMVCFVCSGPGGFWFLHSESTGEAV